MTTKKKDDGPREIRIATPFSHPDFDPFDAVPTIVSPLTKQSDSKTPSKSTPASAATPKPATSATPKEK
jgi:hypothetical protein